MAEAVLARLDENKRAQVEGHLRTLGVAPENDVTFLADVIGMIALALDSGTGHNSK